MTGTLQAKTDVTAAAERTEVGTVTAGEVWHFTAHGTWRNGWFPADAGGFNDRLIRLFGFSPALESARIFTLCGEIRDKNGDPVKDSRFAIGCGRVWQAKHSGELVVFANDVPGAYFRKNNSGQVTLEAKLLPQDVGPGLVQAAEKPASWWSNLADLASRTQGLVFITFLVCACLAVVGWTDAGLDVIRTVLETRFSMANGFMVAAIVYLALQAWFWPRRIIEANYGSDQSQYGTFGPLLRVWPQILGMAPFVVAIIAIFRARPEELGQKYLTLFAIAAWGALFAAFVVFRPKLIGVMRDRNYDKLLRKIGIVWPLLALLTSFVVFLFTTFAPAFTGVWLGPSAIVFCAIAGFLPPIALIGQVSSAYRFPTVLAVLVFAVLCGFLNDGTHRVGRRAFHPDIAVWDKDPRPTMEEALTAWQAMPPAPGTKTTPTRPLFIVATEGGASRAGFWTAVVLDTLQKNRPGFSNDVFAISSISGGSVGAVGWVKALHDQPYPAGRVVDFAGGDALSPALAGDFFPDALQNLLPGALLPDGAEGLEKGWERSWRKACKSCDGLDRPFLDLWPAKTDLAIKPWVPVVMIGGASEETGHRVVTSSVILDGDKIDAYDFFSLTGRNVRQSTAILNGARFPYVTPPGRVELPLSKHGGGFHIVDGGYFDPSGVETARQLMNWVTDQPEISSQIKADKLRPVLIMISYLDAEKAQKEARPNALVNDALGPLRGLYKSRDGHDDHLLDPDNLMQGHPAWQVCNIVIRGQPNAPLPMSWALSTKVQTYMRNYVSKGIRTIENLPDTNGSGEPLICDKTGKDSLPVAAPAPAL